MVYQTWQVKSELGYLKINEINRNPTWVPDRNNASFWTQEYGDLMAGAVAWAVSFDWPCEIINTAGKVVRRINGRNLRRG